MKILRNKKVALIMAVIMAFLSFNFTFAFAESNEKSEIIPTFITDDDTVSTLSVTPSTPYIWQGTFVYDFGTSFEEYSGGDRVSISAVATDSSGNTVSGAGIHVALVEYETGNTVASLNISADGVAKVANGNIVSGRHYRFECTSDMLHMDTQFSIRLVSVVF